MLKPLFFTTLFALSFSLVSCTALTQNRAATRPDHPDLSLRTRSYEQRSEILFATLLDIIKALPLWEVLQSDLQKGLIQATRTTRLFHFVDDIEIQITKKSAQEVEVDVRSASRVGKGDLGQNARNIRQLLKKLDQSL